MSAAGTEGAVFVQTNEPQNAVVVLRRSAAGALEPVASHPTGGAGDGEPHLPSQGSVVLTGDGEHLLVTNVASDDVSLFAVGEGPSLELVDRRPAETAPRSVAEHDGLVYTLSPGRPALVGFRLGAGGLEAIAGAATDLPADSDPAQVGFSPDGTALVVTERGTDTIVSFAVNGDGSLGAPHRIPSSGPTPYGFAVTSRGTLVVTEAFRAEKGAAAASSYSVRGGAITPVTGSVHNGRSEICWAVVTPDDRFAFTTNFADGAVSRFAIGDDGGLRLDDATAGLSVDGRAGLRDESLTTDGRFLYAIDADFGSIFGWAVGEGGTLSPLGSWGGLPPTAAGLAAS